MFMGKVKTEENGLLWQQFYGWEDYLCLCLGVTYIL